jgi:hypothetical protein
VAIKTHFNHSQLIYADGWLKERLGENMQGIISQLESKEPGDEGEVTHLSTAGTSVDSYAELHFQPIQDSPGAVILLDSQQFLDDMAAAPLHPMPVSATLDQKEKTVPILQRPERRYNAGSKVKVLLKNSNGLEECDAQVAKVAVYEEQDKRFFLVDTGSVLAIAITLHDAVLSDTPQGEATHPLDIFSADMLGVTSYNYRGKKAMPKDWITKKLWKPYGRLEKVNEHFRKQGTVLK